MLHINSKVLDFQLKSVLLTGKPTLCLALATCN